LNSENSVHSVEKMPAASNDLHKATSRSFYLTLRAPANGFARPPELI
jgi:hypothetical protein